jgi:hypothetical protein
MCPAWSSLARLGRHWQGLVVMGKDCDTLGRSNARNHWNPRIVGHD